VACDDADDDAAVLMPVKLSMGGRSDHSGAAPAGCVSVNGVAVQPVRSLIPHRIRGPT
jgi:hypothetical protein